MRTRLAILAIAGLLVLLGPRPAAGIPLTNWNVAELNAAGDYVDVTMTTEELAPGVVVARLAFQWFAGAGNTATATGLDMAGYNGTTFHHVVGITGNSVRWDFNINPPPPQFDGFGAFNSTVNQGPGETGGIAAPIVLTLEFGDLFALAPNDQGGSLVARVTYGNGCTAFVSNGTSTSVGADSRCGPGQSVPEASSLALLGVGLVVAGLLLTRSRRPTRHGVARPRR